MTWPQVRELAAQGLAFGGHSRTHRLLTDISLTDAAAEADDSRQAIAAALGAAPDSFAYPNGNWNQAVADRVAGSGYTLAFTTDSGHVAPGDAPFSLTASQHPRERNRDAGHVHGSATRPVLA